MTSIFTGADAILDAVTIRQVTNSSHATNQQHFKGMNSGGAVVQTVSAKSIGEVTTLTSADIAGMLGIGTSTFCSVGLYVASGTVTVPYSKRSDGALFASGSAHPALTGAKALIIPTSFEVSNDADFATGSFEIHWLSADGLTKGCDDATGAALGSQSFNGAYTLGPVYINGTVITGVQSFRVTPGIEVIKPPLGSGSIAPIRASIKQVMPTIQITVNDFDAIAGTVGDATAMTSANLYFKKRADSGIFASGTNHCRVTFAAGLADTDTVSVSNNDDGSATITLHGKTLTAATGVALPS